MKLSFLSFFLLKLCYLYSLEENGIDVFLYFRPFEWYWRPCSILELDVVLADIVLFMFFSFPPK